MSQVYIGSLISFIRLSVNFNYQSVAIFINSHKLPEKIFQEVPPWEFPVICFVWENVLRSDLCFFLFFLILRLKYLKFSEPQGGKHNAGKNEIYSIDFIIYHFTMPEEHCYLKAAWVSYQLILFAKWFNSSKRKIWGLGVVINYLYTHRITPSVALLRHND